MARKKSPTLTEAELRLMKVIWKKKSATVQEVVDAVKAKADLAYSTVLTTLRILEEKGYLKHRKKGRAFEYFPVVSQDTAQQSALKYVMSRFFNNDAELLVLNLLKDDSMDKDDLARLRQMIADAEDEGS